MQSVWRSLKEAARKQLSALTQLGVIFLTPQVVYGVWKAATGSRSFLTSVVGLVFWVWGSFLPFAALSSRYAGSDIGPVKFSLQKTRVVLRYVVTLAFIAVVVGTGLSVLFAVLGLSSRIAPAAVSVGAPVFVFLLSLIVYVVTFRLLLMPVLLLADDLTGMEAARRSSAIVRASRRQLLVPFAVVVFLPNLITVSISIAYSNAVGAAVLNVAVGFATKLALVLLMLLAADESPLPGRP